MALDGAGDVYVAGQTLSADFPTTQSAHQHVLAGNLDGFISKLAMGAPATLALEGILPNTGGNAGTVTTTIIGSGFHSGVTATLDCGDQFTIGANGTQVGLNGRIATAAFALNGVMPGACDLRVTNPDGGTVVQANGFTVEPGGEPDVRITKIGTTPVPGRRVSYYLTAHNMGNIDATVGFGSESIDPAFSVASVAPAAITEPPLDWPSILWSLPLSTGETEILSYHATVVPSTSIGSTVVGGPWCFLDPLDIAAFSACLVQDPDAAECGEAAVFCAAAAISCPPVLPPSFRVPNPLFNPANCLRSVGQCVQNVRSCSPVISRCLGTRGRCTSLVAAVVGARDPNEIVGPSGVGTERWLSGVEPLSYAISFENVPSATAAAQQVFITDQLPPSAELASLQLAGIIVDGRQMPIPASFQPRIGSNSARMTLDLRPTKDLLLEAEVNLDPVKRSLSWSFNTIDPATGALPEDPTIGFLDPGSGGTVAFAVSPIAGLSTGVQISNQAAIVFDVNPAIATNIWTNTIDDYAPQSRVNTLPPLTSSPSFSVSWAGADVGAGIDGYSVLVSDNGGPFTVFQGNTTASAAIFVGEMGHTYSFYSIARDLVGNVEVAKTVGEATTTVTVGDTTAPAITASRVPAPNSNKWNNSPVTVGFSCSDSQSGLAPGSPPPPTVVSTEEANQSVIGTCTDLAGNSASMTVGDINIDLTAPVISCTATPGTLWPPNGEMIPVNVSISLTDSLSGSAGFKLVSITTNEPGDDKVEGFVLGSPSTTGKLRARRLGSGTGRVYTLTYEGADRAGNVAMCTTAVTVPHDQRKE
jgi:hypothetical protein